jgi:hypothetical protein
VGTIPIARVISLDDSIAPAEAGIALPGETKTIGSDPDSVTLAAFGGGFDPPPLLLVRNWPGKGLTEATREFTDYLSRRCNWGGSGLVKDYDCGHVINGVY